MKKMLTTIFAVIALCFVFVGCGTSTSGKTGAKDTDVPAQPHVLSWNAQCTGFGGTDLTPSSIIRADYEAWENLRAQHMAYCSENEISSEAPQYEKQYFENHTLIVAVADVAVGLDVAVKDVRYEDSAVTVYVEVEEPEAETTVLAANRIWGIFVEIDEVLPETVTVELVYTMGTTTQ